MEKKGGGEQQQQQQQQQQKKGATGKKRESAWKIDEERWLKAYIYMVASFGIWWIDLYCNYTLNKSPYNPTYRTGENAARPSLWSIIQRELEKIVLHPSVFQSVSDFPSAIQTQSLRRACGRDWKGETYGRAGWDGRSVLPGERNRANRQRFRRYRTRRRSKSINKESSQKRNGFR